MRAWLHQLISRPSRPPSRYRQLIALLPIPTAEQTESFAEYLVGAHSWYKHLPCDPPGAPFVVFLDPNAGRKLVQTADGGEKYRDCVDERERFHYTWMPTAEYLTKFGHWHYEIDRGTQFVRRLPASKHARVDPPGFARVTATDGTSIDVSPEVIAAGTVYLTAYVHESFGTAFAQVSASGLRERREDQGVERQIEAEHARQCAELRVALHRVRSLLTRGNVARP